MRQLTGPEIGILRTALEAHYDIMTIRPFTEIRIDKGFLNFVSPLSPFNVQLFEFIKAANQRGWQGELINAFLAEHPEHEEVLKLAFSLGIGSGMYQEKEEHAVADLNALEEMVNDNPFLDLAIMLKELGRIERCVCRIEVEKEIGRSWGTGFLVGPDLILTNYHVLQSFIEEPAKVKSVNCVFDYKVLPDGSTIHQGTEVHPAGSDPILAFSPYGQLDVSGSDNLQVNWPEDELDYALMKLERPIGNEPFGPQAGGTPMRPAKRGWIPVPSNDPALPQGGHVIIVQHPKGSPQKIAFGFSKSEGTDQNKMRLRYKVNTKGGSSGSPCFNEKYEWVALHNMGDPSWNPVYNQGIVAQKIIADLKTKNIDLSSS